MGSEDKMEYYEFYLRTITEEQLDSVRIMKAWCTDSKSANLMAKHLLQSNSKYNVCSYAITLPDYLLGETK